MTARRDYDGVFLGGINGPQAIGRFKLSEAGLGWKNQTTGEIITVPAAEVRRVHWIRVARGYQLRITRVDGTVIMFDGFQKETQDDLSSLMRQLFKVSLDVKETSLKGINWGSADFQSTALIFNIGNKSSFEIPLSHVANSTVGGKNEVSIEFALPQAPPAANGTGTGRIREDTLVEARFFVPGTVTAGQIDEDSTGRRQFRDRREDEEADREDLAKGREAGEIAQDDQEVVVDNDGEAVSAAHLFCETIKRKADMGIVQGEAIVSFSELLCLTPRGRFVVDMHDSFLRLRGKSHDYKIQYTAIKKLFLLPKPDDLHYMFVVGLDPPLRQGQTRYPHLVFQFGREDEIELDLALSEEAIEERYEGNLQKSYDGPLYVVVSDVFRGLTERKLITPSAMYKSAHGQSGLKCSFKANEAILYPLDKAFLSTPKPAIFFTHADIVAVTFARVSSGAAASTKTFEVKFSLRSGVEYSFSSISREEHGPLEAFCNAKKLRTKNEFTEEGVSYRENGDDDDDDEDEDDDDEGGRGRRGLDAGGYDDDDESEDSDFIDQDQSDVDEEFNEDYESPDEEDGNHPAKGKESARSDGSSKKQRRESSSNGARGSSAGSSSKKARIDSGGAISKEYVDEED